MEEIVECTNCNGNGCSVCNNMGFFYRKGTDMFSVSLDSKGEPEIGAKVAVPVPTTEKIITSTNSGFWNIIFNSFNEPQDLLWFLKRIKRARS